MRLLLKINVVLLIVFLIGLAASYQVADRLLQENARSEIQGNARIMMESALAVRTYTLKQINPLLKTQIRYHFFPQPGPPSPANKTFNLLRLNCPPAVRVARAGPERRAEEHRISPDGPVSVYVPGSQYPADHAGRETGAQAGQDRRSGQQGRGCAGVSGQEWR